MPQPIKKPIYDIDLSRPLSELVCELRSQLATIRGKMDDIGDGFPRWDKDAAIIRGALTCAISYLYGTAEQMKKVEAEQNSKSEDATLA